ncbi:MAG: ATP-binding protein [Myxococcota bacterium]
MANRSLPKWAEDIRSTYLRGESSVFIIHGNVYDQILFDGKLVPLVDFLSTELIRAKDLIVQFNPAIGIKFKKKEKKLERLDELLTVREADKAIAALDQLLLTQDNVAILVDYAEMIAPAEGVSFQSDADRRSIVTLHRWSLDKRFEHSNNIILLITETITELSPKLVSNPKITTIQVPLPSEADRAELVKALEPKADEKSAARLAALSAGLKNVQIRGILAPGEDAEEEQKEREDFIYSLIANEPNAKERAQTLARMFVGKDHDEIQKTIAPGRQPVKATEATRGRYDDVFVLLGQRKREILEKECFGLIEFVEPGHDFSHVGGIDGVKTELMNIARNIQEGNRTRVPMGLLFTGPMGTGKTFVAEAFAKSSGLTAIKLKNFRSKWVGSTEGNLEKILSVVKAIGNILVIIDEGDRAFGNSSDDGDGGTSSRVIARIKEFMSDTQNRGRVLFVLMTNRPDKLDIDIKRAGRLDKKIPFFYGQDAQEIEPILTAQLRRHKVDHDLEFPRDRIAVSEKLIGYSNADVEAVVLLANDKALSRGSRVTVEIFGEALRDYLPARDSDMLEYMELLAVFESSSRSMLPKRYADMDKETLSERMRALKARVR